MKLGEEMLRCEPFAYVVNQSLHRTVCDFCLKKEDKDVNNRDKDGKDKTEGLKKCIACRYVYYCDKTCQRGSWRMHRDECKYLKAVSPKVPTDTVRLIARIILKLRMGGNVEIAKLPDGSCRRFDDLESHSKSIVKDPCRIKAFVCFFGVLQELFRDSIPPKSEVLDIYGRVLINSFNILNEENKAIGVGLYLPASAIDHSCRPNAAVSFDGRFLSVRCIDPHVLGGGGDDGGGPGGEDHHVLDDVQFGQVRISYIDSMADTRKRQKELREQYYFECGCPACRDMDGLEGFKEASVRCPTCSHAIPAKQLLTANNHSNGNSLTNGNSSNGSSTNGVAVINNKDLVCPHCQNVPPEDHLRQYLDLRHAVLSSSSKKDEDSRFVHLPSMRPLFHPLEKTYSSLLDAALEHKIKSEDWASALETADELLVAYTGLYPPYDAQTAMLLMKMAKLCNHLGEVDRALVYGRRAAEIVVVTHGRESRMYREGLAPLMADIEGCKVGEMIANTSSLKMVSDK